jgi:endonuclease YncB( thermonuclease family)
VAITYALVPWATWFLSVFPPPAFNYAGTVTHVRDGDTIEVNGKPIRIANLDCAELGTDEEAKAHHHMLNLAPDRNVECHLRGQTSYDRFVGTCRLIGGDDVGQIMVDAGMCGWWR